MEWRLDETDLSQTETEEHESQVPIVKASPKSPTPQEAEAHQASGHGQCKSCADTVCRHVALDINIHRV